jgi:hypothetical protein
MIQHRVAGGAMLYSSTEKIVMKLDRVTGNQVADY